MTTRQTAVLKLCRSTHLERALRLIAALELTATGTTPNYQPTTGRDTPHSRPPSTGDPNPPHYELLHRIATAQLEPQIVEALEWGQTELERLQRAPRTEHKPETPAQLDERLTTFAGQGWTARDVALALGQPEKRVKQAWINHGRDPYNGRPIDGLHKGMPVMQRVTALKARGFNQREIAQRLGVHQSTISRLLKTP
jgi:hypothetical protein